MNKTNISNNIKVCRLCGQVSDKPVISIFDAGINNLHEKINEYLPITVKADDSLPLTSCVTCTNTLLAFDQLVVTCMQANKYFEELHAKSIQVIAAKLEEADSPEQTDEAFRSGNDQDYKTFCNEEPVVQLEITHNEFKYAMKQNHSKAESELVSTEKGYKHVSESAETNAIVKDIISIDNKIYYQCGVCSKSFNSAQSYKSHQKIHTGERPYVCEFCGKQFRIIQGLRRHIIEIHAGIKKFQCDLCERCFKTKQCVVEHRNIHTNERPYVCDVCGKAFRQKSSLFVHNRVHTNEFPFSCEHCNKAFRTKHLMIRHSTVHTGEKPHACDVCGKSFRSKNELNRHKYVHSDWKPFKCHLCGLAFRMNRYLKKHLKSNHNSGISVNNLCTLNGLRTTENVPAKKGNLRNIQRRESDPKLRKSQTITYEIPETENVPELGTVSDDVENSDRPEAASDNENEDSSLGQQSKPTKTRRRKSEINFQFFCHICNNGYTRKYDLEKHQHHKHGSILAERKPTTKGLVFACKYLNDDGKPFYKCDVCLKSFSQSFNLLRHRAVHSESREFCCHLCGTILKTVESLQRHIKITHEKVKDFQCDICQLYLTSRQSLSEHMNTHTGDRPYVCEICGSAFKQRVTLARHKLYHSNDNLNFECQTCGKKFRMKSELKLHGRSHSEGQPHKCPVCGLNFKYKNVMERHVKLHTHPGEFACEVCGKKFNQKRYLMPHMARHSAESDKGKPAFAKLDI